jgi:hypothetical protein
MLTFKEWGEEVRASLPDLSVTAEKYGLFLNRDAAERLLDEGEYQTVLAMIQAVCDGLAHDPAAFADHAEVCIVVGKYPHEETH